MGHGLVHKIQLRSMSLKFMTTYENLCTITQLLLKYLDEERFILSFKTRYNMFINIVTEVLKEEI